MASPPLEPLARALDRFGALVAAVGPEQWSLATPCEAWDAEELVRHVASGQRLFALLVRGRPFDTATAQVRQASTASAAAGPAGLAAEVASSAEDLLAAFDEPGALERMVTVPAGTVPGAVAVHLRTTEVLVHGWDLARATGLSFEVPDDLAAGELAFSRPMLERIPPERRSFAPPQPVADTAPAIDRLVALLGHDPAWLPAPAGNDTPWEPPLAGTEAEHLLGALDRLRATFRWKADDLDAAGLQTRVGRSSLTLGGLLKHLAVIEDFTTTTKLSGDPLGAPWDPAVWDDDGDWEFTSAERDTPQHLYALWDGAVERSRARIDAALAAGGLDQPVDVTAPDGRHASLRRLVCDLVEEYGRHTGHADLLREAVDGRTGEDPPPGWRPVTSRSTTAR